MKYFAKSNILISLEIIFVKINIATKGVLTTWFFITQQCQGYDVTLRLDMLMLYNL